MSTTNDKTDTRNENSKKVDESSNTDSGFLSGFQDSREINYSSEVEATDKETGLEGISHTHDKDNFEDSGLILSGYISETKSEPIVSELPYVPDCMKDLFKRPAHNPAFDRNFEQDEDGYTQLHIAILHNIDKVTIALINLVPDASYLDIRNFCGQTALHLAVLLDQPATVKRLINAGANINMRDNRCNTALHLACLNENDRCVNIIISAVSTQKGSNLLADLEQWNYDGETCFNIACKAKSLSIMRVLVAGGANVNAREGRSGYTALHAAVEAKSNEVIKFLCEECKTMSIDTENYSGLTAFQLSLLSNQESLANYMIIRGATPYFTAEDSDMEEDDASDYSGDELEKNQIISKIAEIAVK